MRKRLIDADRLMERLKMHCRVVHYGDNHADYGVTLADVNRAMHELPLENRWISCKDQMPPDHYVLATTAWGDVTMAERYGEDKWFIHEGATNAHDVDIVAWMPLPLSYKDGVADNV